MADESTAVEISIGAKIDEATAAIAELKGVFESFSKEVQGHFSTMGEASSMLLGKITSLVEGFLGFEAIKRSVEMVRDMGIEAEKMGQRLGISQSEASQFVVAIDDVHGSVDQVLGVMQRQNRQLKQNEDSINALGVVTRDSNGDYLSQQQILFNSVDVLNSYKEGTDRNRAAMVLFGGRVGDLTALMKLNSEVMAEAKKKADDLGLTMTKQGAEAVANYRKAMNDLNDVFIALRKLLGEAIMPVLTDLADWLSSGGKEAVDGFAVSVKIIASAFNGLVLSIQIVAEIVKGAIRIMATALLGFAEVASKSLKFDFAGAKDAWQRSADQMFSIMKESGDKIFEDAQKTKKRLDDLWNPDKSETAKPKGGRTFTDPETNADKAAAIDARIAIAKKGLEVETEFLKGEAEAKRITEEQKVAMTRAATDELYVFERSMADQKISLYRSDTKEYKAAIAARDMIDAQHGLDVQKKEVELAAARRKDTADRIALDVDAMKSQVALEAAAQKQIQGYLDQQVQTGQITAQKKLEIERNLLDRIYELNLAELQAEAELYNDPTQLKERQKVLEAIAKLTADHNIALQKNTNDTLSEIGKRWSQVLGTISKAFETSIKGIIMGTTTLRQAMANIFQSILAEFVNLGVKMVEEWIIQEIKKTAATEAGVAARTAAEEAGSAQSIMIWAFTAIKNIMNSAWEAMAAAFKSMVGIPFVGPAIAPAVAAGAFATVAGFAGSVSAAGGYDIPPGVNPVIQAHAQEMVLPKPQAEVIRQMASGGNSAGAMHVTIHAVDAASVRKLFMDHGPALADSMRRQARNFSPTGTPK